MANLKVIAVATHTSAYPKKVLSLSFLFLFIAIFLVQQLQAQCTIPNPRIVSSSQNWTNFDIDGNTASDEFGILHYITGSKIQAYASLVNVYTINGELVNVADGTVFDGTEDISGSGEFNELATGDHQIVFKYIPDGRLGFLNLTVTNDNNNNTTDSIEVTRIAFQVLGDTDGIIAGDCNSLDNTALPIELTYFHAKALDQTILLEWATSAEIDNLGFDIQRSNDGYNFQSIGWRAGQGYSNERVEYSFVDAGLQSNVTYYYRLVNRDRTGGGDISPVRSAQLKGDRFTEVSPAFPNPVVGSETNIQIIGQKSREVQMSIFTNQGHLIHHRVLQIDSGLNKITLEVADYPSGQYIVMVQDEKEVSRRQFMITR